MTTKIIVVCVHCSRILGIKVNNDPNITEDSISHSDCLPYNRLPCRAGIQYHKQVAEDLGFDNFDEYLVNFRGEH
jgi:hypothetical protein